MAVAVGCGCYRELDVTVHTLYFVLKQVFPQVRRVTLVSLVICITNTAGSVALTHFGSLR